VIDGIAIKARFEALSPRLNERARRLFVASEARAAGRGGVTAVSNATGVARSTINRGLVELRSAEPQPVSRIRRPGGGRKPKIETEPGLLEALATLVQSAIRGDPEAALLWVSKSQTASCQCAGRTWLYRRSEAGRTVTAPPGLQPASEQQDPRGHEPPRPRRAV